MFFKASRRRLLHVNIIHLGPRPGTYLFYRYTSLPYTLPRLLISTNFVAMSRANFLAQNHWFDIHGMSFASQGEVNQLQLNVATTTTAHVVTIMLPSKTRERHEVGPYHIQASHYLHRFS
ncbi:hypothetical protein B5807_00928 [Epicoccum nigrum]|uniref:Uncharacterized protein n=1 Tax=Epicoccum nigrum TaxID=105696 RepID=A0A1Y2MCT5_EPING|nr:hypothetical protein B5807_00928 [Epicoccum nigrum]